MRVERNAVADAVRRFAALGDAASALELVGRTWRAWLSHGELDEGSAIIATALAIPSERSAALWHVRVLCADGFFAFRAGDQQRSQASNEKALEIASQIGDVRGECDALTGLARVALRDGRHEGVVALARHAMDRAMSAGDREAGAGSTTPLVVPATERPTQPPPASAFPFKQFSPFLGELPETPDAAEQIPLPIPRPAPSQVEVRQPVFRARNC